MLIKCPECDQNISDKAISCPSCGYPMKKISSVKIRSKTRMRLPNGFGQISEIKGRNLRKPFRAMVCVGKDELGRPICKTLKPEGYFRTYNEAYNALMKYHQSPYDLTKSITMEELYQKWTAQHFKYVGASRRSILTSCWKYCSKVYNIKVQDLQIHHIKDCMTNGKMISDSCAFKGQVLTPTPSVAREIKGMFAMLLDYAVENELVDKNVARMFNVPKSSIQEIKKNYIPHKAFSADEMDKLWSNQYTVEFVDIILFQCYSGFRPSELGKLLLSNVDLKEWTIIGGIKTESGKNRIVPVHRAIRDIVLRHYEESTKLGNIHLFSVKNKVKTTTDYEMKYYKYLSRFNGVIETLELNAEHRPHDPRKQFVTMAKEFGVDEYAIKLIVGHAITDITEKVYTERTVSWLHKEIDKIPIPNKK